MKRKARSLIMLIVLLITLTGCNNKDVETDALKFKNEYETLNDSKNNDGTNKFPEISINEDNVIRYASFDDIKGILEGGTGVIYFGFPECPWCRNAIPVLLDAADITGLDTIYYYNAIDIRDKKVLDDSGNIITEKEGTKEYQYLIEKLYNHLGVYTGLNDETIKRLYFPTVVFVLEGEVLDINVGTVTSQIDPYVGLTDEQEGELKNIYINAIHKVLNDICDEAC